MSTVELTQIQLRALKLLARDEAVLHSGCQTDSGFEGGYCVEAPKVRKGTTTSGHVYLNIGGRAVVDLLDKWLIDWDHHGDVHTISDEGRKVVQEGNYIVR